MAAVPKEILSNLGEIVEQFHSALVSGGSNGIKTELCKCKLNNPFGLGVILTKWDDILVDLKNVAKELKKGDTCEILNAATKLSKGIADIQRFILGLATEIGSFVPGPIGMVCSLVLAIGCFAAGDIPGGFLNLLGAIPGAKLAKFIPISALKASALKFQSALWTKWGYKVSALTQKAEKNCDNFLLSESFDLLFIKSIKSIKNRLSKIGEKINKTTDEILTGINDGWNRAREELNDLNVFEYMLGQSESWL